MESLIFWIPRTKERLRGIFARSYLQEHVHEWKLWKERRKAESHGCTVKTEKSKTY